jgi:hypothetical protein
VHNGKYCYYIDAARAAQPTLENNVKKALAQLNRSLTGNIRSARTSLNIARETAQRFATLKRRVAKVVDDALKVGAENIVGAPYMNVSEYGDCTLYADVLSFRDLLPMLEVFDAAGFICEQTRQYAQPHYAYTTYELTHYTMKFTMRLRADLAIDRATCRIEKTSSKVVRRRETEYTVVCN